MYKVKTMNAIAQQGLDVLTEAGLTVGPELEAPEGLLIRSAAGSVFPVKKSCMVRYVQPTIR